MDLSRFSLEGRTTIITGGSGGIGRACALAFAQAGSNIMIASLPAASIPPVVAEIEALGVSAGGLAVDVSKEDQVQTLVKVTLEQFGRIDALLNVAGGSYSRNSEMPTYQRGALLELSPEDFMGVYDVNAKTAFICSKAVVPHMKEHGKGAIINIGSISGRSTKHERPDMAAYGTAKAAVMNLTFHMANQWGPEVRINAVAPGIIDTPRPGGTSLARMESEGLDNIALGRHGKADEVAGVALFLASDAASFVNGSVVDVNGGE